MVGASANPALLPSPGLDLQSQPAAKGSFLSAPGVHAPPDLQGDLWGSGLRPWLPKPVRKGTGWWWGPASPGAPGLTLPVLQTQLIQMVVWMLQHRLLVQLHTYVCLMASPSQDEPRLREDEVSFTTRVSGRSLSTPNALSFGSPSRNPCPGHLSWGGGEHLGNTWEW